VRGGIAEAGVARAMVVVRAGDAAVCRRVARWGGPGAVIRVGALHAFAGAGVADGGVTRAGAAARIRAAAAGISSATGGAGASPGSPAPGGAGFARSTGFARRGAMAAVTTCSAAAG